MHLAAIIMGRMGTAQSRNSQSISLIKKVLFIIDDLSNGGAERQLALLIKYLPSEWECRVWSLEDGPYAQIIRDLGVQVDIRPRLKRIDVRPTFDLWQIIKEWRPDVVHSWGWMSSFASGPFCNLMKVPLVSGFIQSGRRLSGQTTRFRMGMMFAQKIVANSQAGLSAWNIKPKQGRIVRNGFDQERLVLCQRQNHALAGLFSVVMTGRMVFEKDYQVFFAAARELSAQDGSEWHFVAIGDGPDRNKLVSENMDLIHSGVVSFPDPGIEIIEAVNKAQVGVLMTHPPSAEGISNSIMEYMACGLPVICSDGGGNRELVIEGGTGFIIPPSDVQELAQKLLYLREHPEDARRMGGAGKRRLLDDFSVEKMVGGMLRVYSEVM